MKKVVTEFLSILVFFILYQLFDVFIATAGLVVMSGLQLIYAKHRCGKVDKQQLITFLLLLVFGSLTIIFQDARFLQWKVSLINWGFAMACVISPWVSSKTLLEHLMGGQIKLQAKVWSKVNRMWILFFTLMGALNLMVAYNFSTEIWVYFKLFGLLGLTFIFMLLQSVYLMRHMSGASSHDPR